MPHVIIIAGANGSGKTTTAPALLQDAVHIDNFVNADTIAQGLCAFQPETAAIRAGRIMLGRIHQLANERVNFSFETTLASRTFAPWVMNLKNQGYKFHLAFLWLETAELALFRVRERVKMGGHVVPEATVRRRYHIGLKNFFNLYRPIADSWQFCNNSDLNQFSLIASGASSNSLCIEEEDLWQQLLETYHDQ